MSIGLIINSKAVTWSIWVLLAALSAGMLLYANRAPIAWYMNLAKSVPAENAVAADVGPGAPDALGSAPMSW